MNRFPIVVAMAALSVPLMSTSLPAQNKAKKPAAAKKPVAAQSVAQPAASQRYLPLEELKKLQAQHARDSKTLPALQPLIDGKSLKGRDLTDLVTNPPVVVVHAKLSELEAGVEAEVAVPKAASETAAGWDGERFAQAFPPAATPAPAQTPARSAAPAKPVIPSWVRYPLEFQLAGIGLGTKAVDKDRFNRIDRYGLFALHGNPTAVVVPAAGGGSVSVNQQPPEVASLFPNDPGGGLPDWAAAITVQLDNNHVQWLYRRDTYSMGFVVDRLGYVDAIVVAGVQSPIARTQLDDPIHSVKLGDDLRKVMYRYGYPDTIETYDINVAAGTSVGGVGGGGGAAFDDDMMGGQGAAGLEQVGQQEAAGAGTSGGASNAAFRTFELRYEQSYNVVFTIRNNRVVRIYIFGDPDFFNQQRREALRTSY